MLEIKDVNQYEWLWRHNGRLPGESTRVTLRDAISTANASVFLPRVIQNIVVEAAEPLLIGTSLLQRVNYSAGATITLPSMMGAIAVADIGEGMEFPERSPQVAGGGMTASIGKVGCAVKITEEMLKWSQFDVIGMMLRMAGRGFARHKEKKIFDMIGNMGVKIFDNLTPAASVLGVTHGRSLSGAGNGSVIMDDIFDAYAHVITQGFTPNTILMHPLAWVMWVKDPTLRAFALANGGGTFFATHRGNPAGQNPWAGVAGGLAQGAGRNVVPGGNAAGLTATELLEYPQDIDSAPELPSYFPYPLTILVSPFVPFDPRRKLTDIFMFDRNELGVLFVDEDITTDEFKDPRNDITKLKMKERYGIGILNEGQAVAVIKNVKLVPNEIVMPAQMTITAGVSCSVGSIGMTDQVLL